jgi:UDP-glucose-4-epimerase GalE
MKLLVTGGAGYVGSFCVRALCERDHEVVVYDNLSTGHAAAVDPRAKLVVGDLGDTPALETVIRDASFDGVLHFAAYLNVGESVNCPLKYYKNNVANTITLLELMQRYQVLRLVFSSTCAIYGLPEAVPITEDMPKKPINPYGHTKLAMEWAIRDSAAAWKLGATALRYFNAAGAAADGTVGEDRDPEYHLIPVALEVALGKREQVQVFGVDYKTRDGSCIRDFIHVEDLADAHVLSIESQEPGQFRAFNVGTGVGTSVKQVVDTARTVTGEAIAAKPAPRRAGDPPELYADPGRLMAELGWTPRHTEIRSIVETAWLWHRNHPDGYEPDRS